MYLERAYDMEVMDKRFQHTRTCEVGIYKGIIALKENRFTFKVARGLHTEQGGTRLFEKRARINIRCNPCDFFPEYWPQAFEIYQM